MHYKIKTAVGAAAGLGSTVAEGVESASGSENLGSLTGFAIDFFNPAQDIQETADLLSEVGDDLIEVIYDIELDDNEEAGEEDDPVGESYHPRLIYY